MRWVYLVISALLAIGCSEEPGPSGRAGPTDDALDDVGVPVDLGDIDLLDDPAGPLPQPALPVLTPCPDGWRELQTSEGPTLSYCEPWPEDGHQSCDADAVHFPGTEGCALLGTACPTGNWAADLPQERSILYVQSDAAPGGDGSAEAPFSSISEALAQADPETVLALATGTYDEAVMAGRGVTLWGACVGETVLTRSDATDTDATFTAAGPDVVLRNLQVTGAARGIRVEDGASLAVEDVLVTDTRDAAIDIQGQAELSGQRLVVRDTKLGTTPWGFGLLAAEGATVELDQAAFERNVSNWVEGPDTSLSLRRSVVRDTGAPEEPLQPAGHGLWAAGATVDISESVFECNVAKHLTVVGADGTLHLSSSLIGSPRPSANCHAGEEDPLDPQAPSWEPGDRSPGVHVFAGASGVVERSRLTACDGFGVGVTVTGDLLLRDVIIDDFAQVGEPDGLSAGLFLLNTTEVDFKQIDFSDGIRVELDRVIFANLGGMAIFSYGPYIELTGTDVTVYGTHQLSECDSGKSNCTEKSLGFGMALAAGSHASFDRFLFGLSELCGIQIAREAALDLSHGVVRDNPIGVNVQNADYDYERLVDEVYYLNNARNFDGQQLPVPDPGLFASFF
jgi:hypothetical protein